MFFCNFQTWLLPLYPVAYGVSFKAFCRTFFCLRPAFAYSQRQGSPNRLSGFSSPMSYTLFFILSHLTPSVNVLDKIFKIFCGYLPTLWVFKPVKQLILNADFALKPVMAKRADEAIAYLHRRYSKKPRTTKQASEAVAYLLCHFSLKYWLYQIAVGNYDFISLPFPHLSKSFSAKSARAGLLGHSLYLL